MTRAFKQGFMDKLAQLLDPGFMPAMQDIAAHGTPAVTVATPHPVSTNATSTAVSAPTVAGGQRPMAVRRVVPTAVRRVGEGTLFGTGLVAGGAAARSIGETKELEQQLEAARQQAAETAVSAPAAVALNDKKPVVDETKFKPEDLKLEEKPSVVEGLLGEGPSPGVARAAIPFLQNLDRFRSFDDAKMLAKNFVKNPSFSWTWEF